MQFEAIKEPLGQGMMVCKGWKGGTITESQKKLLNQCIKKYQR